MSRMYVISDTHFNHTNVIKYENRPFSSVEEMNDFMIKEWNDVVSKNDTVFHLGDFCFGNKDIISTIINKLNGRKILIKGNHDKHIKCNKWLELGFEEVYNYPIIYKPGIILSHAPVIEYISDTVNIHGHVHTKDVELPKNNTYINVCVEVINYRPLDLDELIERLKTS